MAPVEHKEFHHGNERDTRATLEREAAKFKDTTTTHNTTRSAETAPVVTGERIHHHVHEHVQPVIQKETVQPHVVHTTIPIHETHHAAPVHHGTSTLPVKTLEEFTSERGGLAERASQKLTEFEGCPKPYRRELQGEQLEGDKSMHLHGHGDNYGENHSHAGREGHGLGRNTEGLAAGAAGAAVAGRADRKHRHPLGHKNRRGSNSSSSLSSSDEESRGLGKSSRSQRGLGSGTGTGVGAGAAATAAGVAHHQHQNREGLQSGGIGNPNTAGLNKSHASDYDQVKTGGLHNDPLNSNSAHVSIQQEIPQYHYSNNSQNRGDSGVDVQTGKKPSLIDRLNPLKDADGDGKKGIMN